MPLKDSIREWTDAERRQFLETHGWFAFTTPNGTTIWRKTLSGTAYDAVNAIEWELSR